MICNAENPKGKCRHKMENNIKMNIRETTDTRTASFVAIYVYVFNY